MLRALFLSWQAQILAELNSIKNVIRREVRSLNRVRHPNVVHLFGACVENVKRPCVVMALASGTLIDEISTYAQARRPALS